MARSKEGELLARVNFPLFVARMISGRHLMVAGGGGRSKTGIANAIEIYELGFNGQTCIAQPATRYETGDTAIMNGTVWFNGKYHVFAAGVEGDTQLYQIKYRIYNPEEEGEVIQSRPSTLEGTSKKLRRRRQSESDKSDAGDEPVGLDAKRRTSNTDENVTDGTHTGNANLNVAKDKNSNSLSGVLGFSIQPLQRIQTDFPVNDEPFQKVVRVSLNGTLMITGGCDGHIRIWKYPQLSEVSAFKAHESEVDDLDIHPLGNKVVSVSRDGHGYVWDIKESKRVCELQWTNQHNQNYRFRSCRYGIVEGDAEKTYLYTAHFPAVRQKKPCPCYLVKWSTNKYIPERVMPAGLEILSSMAISDDGKFIALGTMTGSVDIYIAFSLQVIHHVKKAHNIFVTGLEFLPSSEETHQVVGIRDASVVSVSVDNQIKIHHIPKQSTISVRWLILIMVAILFITFTLMSYLEL